MVAKKTNGYRNYTADGSYWTVRKHGRTFWVLRLRSETYDQLEVWGGYSRAGAAGGAAAQLAYFQAVNEMTESLRGTLHRALDKVGLGALPPKAPVSASEAPANLAVAGDE
jgi:hypothetical protein